MELNKGLTGEKKEKKEEAYVYAEDGARHHRNDISREYLDKLEQEIYQKTQRADLTFWYGGEGYMRKKQEMEGNEKDEYRGIMKEPQIKRRRTGDNIP